MIIHIVPGLHDVSNGMVVVAMLIAKEQGVAEVVDLNTGLNAVERGNVEEVWVHGMWLQKEWRIGRAVLRSGKCLVRMPHGSLSPVYLKHQSPFKKRLVSPIERYFLRKADKIVATCETEADWICAYEPRVKSIEVTNLKRFFNLNHVGHLEQVKSRPLHLLYLGRRHPLKGLEYLEQAVKGIKGVELRIVSNAIGDEKEKVWEWCDVLVLPTLSENFGLVIAEALERGKRVITTDGAPAWGDGLSRVERVDRVEGMIWTGYDGRLVYLKGYRDGKDSNRVLLLKEAIEFINHGIH